MSWAWTRHPTSALEIARQVVHLLPALLLLVAALWRARIERTLPWYLVAVFGVTTAVAQIGWTASGLLSGPGATPSPFDILYLVGLTIGVAGFLIHTFLGVHRRQMWRVASDTAVIWTSGLLIWWVAFYQLGGLPVPDAGRLVFPMADAFVAAIALTAALYQPGRRSLWWLSASIIFATIGDTLALAQVPGEAPSLALSVGWLLPPLCLAGCVATIDLPGTEYEITIPRRAAITAGAAIAAVLGCVDVAIGGEVGAVSVYFAALMVLTLLLNQLASLAEVRRLDARNVRAMAALSESEERFRVVVDGAPIGICVLEDNIVVQVNPRLEALLGFDADDLIGTNIRHLVSEDVVPTLRTDDWHRLPASVETALIDLAWTTPLGEHRMLHLTLSRPSGSTGSRTICLVEDVTEERAATERLADLAVRDPLTRLPNRPAFMEHLRRALDDTTSQGASVAFLDLDRFKVINDSLGHGIGDQLLGIIAARIADAVGDAGVVARFAGDEFTIVMPNLLPNAAQAVMETVLLAIQRPIQLDGGMVSYPTGSIGVAWSQAGGSAEEALAHADAAMYRAKERGRNRVELYDETRVAPAATELQMVSELHRAIQERELRLHYQPVVDVDTLETLGFEALIRWQHPDRGLLPPGDFIQLAEESGLIVPIGTWVLGEALRQHAEWAARWPDRTLTMSVNVAARQVTPDLVALVEDALATTGATASGVWLEITESTLMTDTRMAQQVLGQLRDLGVHITVDDFGTGYSSLTYLQRFPVEGLKVDRSFVLGIGHGGQADAICQAVVSLGTALDLHVVAEGVEDELQLEALRGIGCPFAQGFLFGRPQSVDSIQARLDVVSSTGPTGSPAPVR